MTTITSSNLTTHPSPFAQQSSASLDRNISSWENIQIIDSRQVFTSDLSARIEHWGLKDIGFDYNVVAVLGSQSSGKSTLLNDLFGTNFDVMDGATRQQTTKGIWMCRGKDTNVLIMDVEGTDGRERGEDQDFERKSALFSLASSEILIINIWENQVGLFNGANMSLLRTVFEVNLQLFGEKGIGHRALLLFVVRDYLGRTPFMNIQGGIVTDLERMWQSIAKPLKLVNCQLSEHFDLAFVPLPHKYFMPDKFEADVARLRLRFLNKDQKDCFINPEYHKRIPADGIAFYLKSIWEQVIDNRDLNLPTQRELLAHFRCGELSRVAVSEVKDHVKLLKPSMNVGLVEEIGRTMTTWCNEALAMYDRNASRYDQRKYLSMREDLIKSMHAILFPLFNQQLANLHKSCLNMFRRQLADETKGYIYFEPLITNVRKRCEDEFLSGAKKAVVEGTDWSWKDVTELLNKDIQKVVVEYRKIEAQIALAGLAAAAGAVIVTRQLV